MNHPAFPTGQLPAPGACRQEGCGGAAGCAPGNCSHALLDALPNLVFTCDAHGARLWSSAAWERYTGLTAPALAGQGWLQVMHPEDLAAIQARRQERLAAAAEPVWHRTRLRRHDGAWRWHMVHLVPRHDLAGVLTGWIGSATDVDEMVRAEQARDASEAHLGTVLDALPVGVTIADAQGRLLRDNAAFRALWGMPPQTTGWEQYGEWKAWNTDTGQRIQAHEWALTRALLHGDVVSAELIECEPFDGSARRFFLNNAAPVRDAQGRLLGGVAVTLDVTAQRAASQEREQLLAAEHAARAQSERALAELQERTRQRDQAQLRLDMALAAGRMGVWDWVPATGRSRWNRQMFELLGLTPSADGAVATDAFMSRVHPEDRPALDAVLARAFEGSDVFEMEMRLERADGGACWVLGRGQVLRDAQGAVERMVGVNLDITAQKQAQAALAEAVRAKDVLLYEVHHRVKNNLQIITSLLSLQMRSVRDADARRAIAEAAARVGVMARLHLALYHSGRHSVLELGPWLRRLAQDTLTLLGEGRPIALDFHADDGMALGVDQAVPLSLALAELLTNAVKYAFVPGRAGTVRLHVRRLEPPGVSVLVADDGVGLAPGFELASSSGLGLRIVEALVRQVDGRIEVLQRQGGAAFRIELPVAPLA